MSADALTSLLAERAIGHLLVDYVRLNDAGDVEALAGLFTQDASFARPSAPDAPIIGRAAILAAFLARPPRLARHFVCNVTVTLLDTDRAEVRSTSVLVTKPESGPPVTSVGGFADEVVKVEGRWRFRVRRGWSDF